MPPKTDPYATPLHKTIDALLSILCVAALLILLYGATYRHSTAQPQPASSHSGSSSVLAQK